MGEEIKARVLEKLKIKLFDLYDRCRYPIVRVTSVEHSFMPDKNLLIVKFEGERLCSAHFEAVVSVAKEVLGKEVESWFVIDFGQGDEPLKAEVVVAYE
jgi:hypothetical protein